MSIAVDENGRYLRDNNGRLVRSEHDAYKARIEIALPSGDWLHAPSSGHNLKRFEQLKKTPVNEEEFEKEVVSYLSNYSNEVTDRVTTRDYFKATIKIEDTE